MHRRICILKSRSFPVVLQFLTGFLPKLPSTFCFQLFPRLVSSYQICSLSIFQVPYQFIKISFRLTLFRINPISFKFLKIAFNGFNGFPNIFSAACPRFSLHVVDFLQSFPVFSWFKHWNAQTRPRLLKAITNADMPNWSKFSWFSHQFSPQFLEDLIQVFLIWLWLTIRFREGYQTFE